MGVIAAIRHLGKRAYWPLLGLLPAPLLNAIHYHRLFGIWTLFRHPRTFNEHVQHKKLYVRDPLFVKTADKIAAREYIAERVGPGYTPTLLQTARSSAEIEWDALPDAFVLKSNNGYGTNLIVTDKSRLDIDAVVATADRWLASSNYLPSKEWAYRDIPPMLLVEEYLGDEDSVPADHKLFTFRGTVRMIQFDTDRFGDHRRDLFDGEWRPLTVRHTYPPADVMPPRPERFDEMLELAHRLGEPFEFVRVDLYDVRGRVYVGELTHYPDAGFLGFDPIEFDLVLGRVWSEGRPIPDDYVRAPGRVREVSTAGSTRG